MTGPSAPAPARGGRPTRWPPTELPGLHVDCGRYSKDCDRWLRLPVATFTCRHGCHEVAVGAHEVAEFTARIHRAHARNCPGPTQ